ncbi:MAG: hypothetical protein ACI4EF_09790 [Coprococcus sp.]
MGKKLVALIIILFLGMLIAGCDGTGSLSQKEEESLMDFLVNENYIDEQATLSTDGAGEGELHNYYSDVSVDGKDCILYVKQAIREEDYRVFDVSIKDSEENVINCFCVRIDRKTGAASLYEQSQ